MAHHIDELGHEVLTTGEGASDASASVCGSVLDDVVEAEIVGREFDFALELVETLVGDLYVFDAWRGKDFDDDEGVVALVVLVLDLGGERNFRIEDFDGVHAFLNFLSGMCEGSVSEPPRPSAYSIASMRCVLGVSGN